jgi:hypothetical protein
MRKSERANRNVRARLSLTRGPALIDSLACTVPLAPPRPHGIVRWENRMTAPTEREIAVRAYLIWEENGRPEGKEEEFWHLAKQQLEAEENTTPLGIPDPLT